MNLLFNQVANHQLKFKVFSAVILWSFLGSCLSTQKRGNTGGSRNEKPAESPEARQPPKATKTAQIPQDSKGPHASLPSENPEPSARRRNPPVPGKSFEIPLAQKAHFYFNSGSDEKRRQIFDVKIPVDEGPFDQITLNAELSCPPPACDVWDRVGSISIEGASKSTFEVMRFVTPYGVGVTIKNELTAFQALLSKNTRFSIEIDTWSGPRRDGGRHGAGWILDASLTLRAGKPLKSFETIIPLISRQYVVYGRPQESPQRSATIQWPEKIRDEKNKGMPLNGEIRLFITGHGQGNTENCAEFCDKTHFLKLDTAFEKKRNIWRSDCRTTQTASPQKGTFQYARAGWCPGSMVFPWTEAVDLGWVRTQKPLKSTFSYWPQDYINSRDSGYDQSGHTLPQYLVSALLLVEDDP